MRARKVVNRVFRGTTYYRWIVSVSPKDIERLGWVDGQPLQSFVRGSSLVLEPAVGAGPARRATVASGLEGTIRRRTLGPRTTPILLSRAKE